MSVKFCYWPIKGIGAINRLTAAYVNIPLEEIEFDMNSYFSGGKYENGLDFPNLPYIVDGDLRISEHRAIDLYFCHKAGQPELLGDSLIDKVQVESVLCVISDINNQFFKVVFTPEYEAELTKMCEEGSVYYYDKVKHLSKFLGTDDYLVGDKFTIADIKVAYLCDYYTHVFGSLGLNCPFQTFENLTQLKERVYAKDGIKELVESDFWFNLPYTPPHLAPWVTLPSKE